MKFYTKSIRWDIAYSVHKPKIKYASGAYLTAYGWKTSSLDRIFIILKPHMELHKLYDPLTPVIYYSIFDGFII